MLESHQTITDRLRDIQGSLSDQIAADLRALASESHHPGFDADKSDDKIGSLKKRIEKLRSLRTQVEDTLTEVPL